MTWQLISTLKGPKGDTGDVGTVERGLLPYNTYVTGWTNKAYEGWWDIDNAARANSIDGLPAEAAGMPGRFNMSAAANGIPFQIFMTYGSGGNRTQQGVYYRTIMWFDQPYGEWVNLAAKPSGLGTSGSPEHMMRESEMRRRRGVRNTKGKGVVTFVFDHGTNNFNDVVLPALKARNLVATLALNSQMYDPAQSRYQHDNQTTWTMIKGWANNDGIEIANHGRTHNNFQDAQGIEKEVRGGREELEANLGFPIDSYVQVGVSKPGFGGFDNGETPEAYWETEAGQIILSSHAVATGSLPAPKFYPMDGTITQGMSGFWIDAGATGISSAQTQIQTAISTGQSVVIRCHPEVLNVGANTTTAQLNTFLDWVKARVDAGEIEVLQLRDMATANDYKSDRTTPTVATLPTANAGNRGWLVYVTAEGKPYFSNGTSWQPINNGTQGEPGPAGPGVPEGGSALQVIRKNSVNTTTEWATLTKSLVGLGNVDNTSDDNKPVSAATTVALNGKADKTALTAGLLTKVDVTALSPKIAEQAVQADYVAQIEAKSPHKAVQIVKVDAGEALQVAAHSPSGAFTTHLIEGTNAGSGRDDYRIVGDIYAGKLPVASKQYADLATTGTFVATSEQFAYTTQVGATLEVTVSVPYAGAEIRFYPYKDNRGGVWKFTLGGQDTSISTFSASAAQETNGFLVSPPGIPKGNHVLRGEFMGDDPGNPPSGGAGTARGWLARVYGTGVNTGQYDTFKLPDLTAGWAQGTQQGVESNREFAWWLKRAGTEQIAEWIPYHTADTAFNAEPARFFDGDRELNVFRMTLGEALDLTGAFKMVQHVYGRNTAEPTVNLLDIWTTTTIHPSGRMTIEGKIRVNFNIEVTHPYVIMNPLNSSVFDTVISPIGNVYPNTVAQEGTNTWLPESDWGESWLFLSSSQPDQAAAFRYNNPVATTRRGGVDKTAEANRSWLEHRAGGTILKHYQKLWATGAVIPAGTVHRFSGDYVHAQVPNAFGELSV